MPFRRTIAVLVFIDVYLGSMLWSGCDHDARANGRFPATVNVHVRADDQDFILVPATFGLLLSKNGGQSFQWVCEEAIGYGGTYDPDYAVAADGRIFATTFAGLRVSTDSGCTFETLSGLFRTSGWVKSTSAATGACGPQPPLVAPRMMSM
jgi:hypothetical protein